MEQMTSFVHSSDLPTLRCAGRLTLLEEPAPSAGEERLYAADVADHGYVWDLTRVWHISQRRSSSPWNCSFPRRSRGVDAARKGRDRHRRAATIGDSYCAAALGQTSDRVANPPTAIAAVLPTTSRPTNRNRRCPTGYARSPAGSQQHAARHPASARRGFKEPQIVARTIFAGPRTAFLSINGAPGTRPDTALAEAGDPVVLAAIT